MPSTIWQHLLQNWIGSTVKSYTMTSIRLSRLKDLRWAGSSTESTTGPSLISPATCVAWFFYDFYLPHIGDINGNLEQRQSRKKLIPLGNLMASRKPGSPMIKIGWQDSGQIGYMITSCHSVWNIHSRGKGNWTLVTARTRRGTASHKAGMLESQKAAVIYYCRCYC